MSRLDDATLDELRLAICRRNLENLESQLLDLASVHLDRRGFDVLARASEHGIRRYLIGLMDAEEPNTLMLDLIEAVMAVKATAARAEDLGDRVLAHASTKQVNWSLSTTDTEDSEPWQADDYDDADPAFSFVDNEEADEPDVMGWAITEEGADDADDADDASSSSDGLVNGYELEDVFYDSRHETNRKPKSEDTNGQGVEVNGFHGEHSRPNGTAHLH